MKKPGKKVKRIHWQWMPISLSTCLIMLVADGCLKAISDRGAHWFVDLRLWIYFGSGCLASALSLLLLYRISRHRWLPGLTQQFLFLHRFNHELAHAIAALATGCGISSFSATSHGGAVQVGRITQRSFIVAIAPYIVSIPSLALILIELVSPAVSPIFWFVFGAAYLYQVLSTVASMSPGQSDFRQIHYSVCVAWIISMLILTSGLIASLVAGGRQEAMGLSIETAQQSAHIVHSGFASLPHLFH